MLAGVVPLNPRLFLQEPEREFQVLARNGQKLFEVGDGNSTIVGLTHSFVV